MKKITEMSREEILALTDEDIKRLCDYECALHGIPLVEKPAKPETKTFEKDTEIYEISRGYHTMFEVRTAEQAAKILKYFMDEGIEFVTTEGNPSVIKFLNNKEIKVEANPAMSQGKYDEIKEEKVIYDTAKEKYDQELADYKKIMEQRENACQYIHGTINSTWDDKYTEDRLTIKFKQYLELAEGDKTIAVKFLKDAESVPKDIEERILAS